VSGKVVFVERAGLHLCYVLDGILREKVILFSLTAEASQLTGQAGVAIK
jgi:hypothetical protein